MVESGPEPAAEEGEEKKITRRITHDEDVTDVTGDEHIAG